MISAPMFERRTHLRAYVPIVVTMRSWHQPIGASGLLQNLSEGGALVTCQECPSTDEDIIITFHIPGGDDLRLNAVVRRTGRWSDGCFWVAMRFEHVIAAEAKAIGDSIRAELASRTSRAVLVADEGMHALRNASDVLLVRGYRPLLASTLLQARSRLESENDAVILALVGVKLASGSGEQLLDWLGEVHPRLHRAVLTRPLDGKSLQVAIDRSAIEGPPRIPWVLW